MIIGGFRVSLRGHRLWKAVSFSAGAMPKQGAGWGWEQSSCSFHPGFLTVCLWAGYFTFLSLVYYMRLAMLPTEDRLS